MVLLDLLNFRILASLYAGTVCIWNYQTQVGEYFYYPTLNSLLHGSEYCN